MDLPDFFQKKHGSIYETPIYIYVYKHGSPYITWFDNVRYIIYYPDHIYIPRPPHDLPGKPSHHRRDAKAR